MGIPCNRQIHVRCVIMPHLNYCRVIIEKSSCFKQYTAKYILLLYEYTHNLKLYDIVAEICAIRFEQRFFHMTYTHRCMVAETAFAQLYQLRL